MMHLWEVNAFLGCTCSGNECFALSMLTVKEPIKLNNANVAQKSEKKSEGSLDFRDHHTGTSHILGETNLLSGR